MTDKKHLTAQVTELFDPQVYPPPKGVELLLINPSGVLIMGRWSDSCLAWGPKPKIPDTVKARMTKTYTYPDELQFDKEPEKEA